MSLYETLSNEVAEDVARQLKEKPDSCFGLPTGRSPVKSYELLRQRSSTGDPELKLDWSKARCFALDEYLECDSVWSFQSYLEKHIYASTNLPQSQRFNPRFVDGYDDLIGDCGGLDLTILGLGTNGHIAFNEPGTPFQSYTHCMWLTESTRESNKVYFEESKNVPYKGVTMGIATIMASRKIILLCIGEQKRGILDRALGGSVDPDVPASILRNHPNLKVLCDFQR